MLFCLLGYRQSADCIYQNILLILTLENLLLILILLPRSSDATFRFEYPSFIRGYANDRPAAHKNAKTDTNFLFLNIELLMSLFLSLENRISVFLIIFLHKFHILHTFSLLAIISFDVSFLIIFAGFPKAIELISFQFYFNLKKPFMPLLIA